MCHSAGELYYFFCDGYSGEFYFFECENDSIDDDIALSKGFPLFGWAVFFIEFLIANDERI